MPVKGENAELVEELDSFIAREVERNGGSTAARKPAHRVKFHWPPHPVSYSYHVLASDWTGGATLEAHGQSYAVEVANTPYGIFGRCNGIWLEARGESLTDMLEQMKLAAHPLFHRQFLINRTLERDGPFVDYIRDLPPVDLLKLLYCEDRDVANDARIEIETHSASHRFTPALILILRDRRHPYRRSAQWCVLDLFEDLTSFCRTRETQFEAVKAMRDLLWDAEDDYARTIYKAGVVLGGHLPHMLGGPALLECLNAPSRIGRRSAIHGLFHVVEWMPSMRDEIVLALQHAADAETDPPLKDFARLMSRDIAHGDYDHIPEPVFPEEQ